MTTQVKLRWKNVKKKPLTQILKGKVSYIGKTAKLRALGWKWPQHIQGAVRGQVWRECGG